MSSTSLRTAVANLCMPLSSPWRLTCVSSTFAKSDFARSWNTNRRLLAATVAFSHEIIL